MQLSAFGITAGHGKAAPSAGHDTSACTLVNSSCSGGAVQVARGNRISRAPSPGTSVRLFFGQFWEREIVKNAPHRSGNGTLFRIFRSSKFRTIPFFSFRTFPCETLGIPAAAWLQLSVRDLR